MIYIYIYITVAVRCPTAMKEGAKILIGCGWKTKLQPPEIRLVSVSEGLFLCSLGKTRLLCREFTLKGWNLKSISGH